MVAFQNDEKQVITTPQAVYDNLNGLVFADDTKVFGKLVARTLIAEQTKDVPGDIVECGVFKGSGVLTWLKLKRLLMPGALKKVIGFDYFNTEALLESLSGLDKQRMAELFSERSFSHENGAEQWVRTCAEKAGFSAADLELVQGDITRTAEVFCSRRPGFKASVLYLDLDVAVPTYEALRAFWPRLSRGGLVVLDEYAYHQWSEAQGADRFFDEVGATIKTLPFSSPTAFVRKE